MGRHVTDGTDITSGAGVASCCQCHPARKGIYGDASRGKRRSINKLLIDDRPWHLWSVTSPMARTSPQSPASPHAVNVTRRESACMVSPVAEKDGASTSCS